MTPIYHVSDDDDNDEVFVLDPIDMADDKTVMPPVFSGKAISTIIANTKSTTLLSP